MVLYVCHYKKWLLPTCHYKTPAVARCGRLGGLLPGRLHTLGIDGSHPLPILTFPHKHALCKLQRPPDHLVGFLRHVLDNLVGFL